jgi:hypothetical protein
MLNFLTARSADTCTVLQFYTSAVLDSFVISGPQQAASLETRRETAGNTKTDGGSNNETRS